MTDCSKDNTTKRRIRLMSFGEVLWDIIEGKPHIGGAPFNLAAHASRCGLESYLATGVGADELGRKAVAEIDRLNVCRRYVKVDNKHPTGTVTVTLSVAGQPSYVIHRDVAWDFISLSKGDLSRLPAENFSVICFGTLVQRELRSRNSLLNVLAKLHEVPVFYDVNLRQDYYSGDIVREGLKRTTILKLNDGEVRELSVLIFGRKMKNEDFVRKLQDEFLVKIVLVTMGVKGCLVAEGGRVKRLKGHVVKVADTVGAGDAFSAAFLAGWLRGKSAIESAEMGNVLGAYVASKNGAIPDYNDKIRAKLEVR